MTSVASSRAALNANAPLERTWADPTGFIGWFAHVDHKSIGRRSLVTSFVFFALGGVLAGLMRIQLARPDNEFLGPDLYNQIFTVHGTAMMFLFAVPIMEAIGLYLVPLMLGTRNVAFPRLNAFGYIFYCGSFLLSASFPHFYRSKLSESLCNIGWLRANRLNTAGKSLTRMVAPFGMGCAIFRLAII